MNPAWTILSLLNWTTTYFTEKKVESPRPSAEILLSHVLQIPRIQLYAQFDQPLTEDELSLYKSMIKRRVNGEPVAYITGQKGFWTVTLEVTPAVLIPRPETELLIETALTLFSGSTVSLQILDLGTGSGAISVALAEEFPNATLVAVDKSEKALSVAQKNVQKYHKENQIHLLLSDWTTNLSKDMLFDLIVSNPPYIPSKEISTLQREVKEFEPTEALDGGPNGLNDIFFLLDEVYKYIKNKGFFMMEVGHSQKEAIESFLADKPFWENITFIKDYEGIDRIVCVQKK